MCELKEPQLRQRILQYFYLHTLRTVSTMDDYNNKDSSTYPLHEAVKAGDEVRIKDLIVKANETGLNINEEDRNSFSALIEACVTGNERIVRLLLKAGCPAQPPPDSRHNPLRGACVAGQAHILPILIDAGADVNAFSDGRRTPLMGACFLRPNVPEYKSALCTKALLQDPRIDPTIRNSFGETAMDLARIRGYEESIAMIEKSLRKS
jgi:ankyrin repeat protein